MTQGVLIMAVILSLIYCTIQNIKLKRIRREIKYVSEDIEKVIAEERSYILEVSENTEIRKLESLINRILEKSYDKELLYKKSYKAMQCLFTNVSHDFRTPLTVLNGYSEILMIKAKKLNMEKEVLDVVSKINIKSNELVNSINNIFDSAKLESGDKVLKCEKIDIVSLTKSIILEYYDILEKSNIDVCIEAGEKPIYVRVDKEVMTRVIKNLIDNAIKYGMAGKYLGFLLKEGKDKVILEVEDHGKGIKPQDIDKIFTRRYTSGRGSGLGLSIISNLLKSMNGSIKVRSTLGEGTIFYVCLKKLEIS